MGSLSDYAEGALLNHLFGTTGYTSVATVYVGLWTAPLADASTGATAGEVSTSGTAYARTAITFGAAASRMVIQSGAVTFPTATAAWGTITDWAICDAVTAGNILAYGTFTAAFSPVTGNTPTIPTSQIQVQFIASSGAGFVDACLHNLLNLMFRNIAYTRPSTYIGLATAVLSDTTNTVAGVTEVAGGNYARKQVNQAGGASPAWNNAAAGVVTNANVITFNTPSATWGTITSCFIADSPTGAGNILGYDNSNVLDQTVSANDTVQFDIAAFSNTMS